VEKGREKKGRLQWRLQVFGRLSSRERDIVRGLSLAGMMSFSGGSGLR